MSQDFKYSLVLYYHSASACMYMGGRELMFGLQNMLDINRLPNVLSVNGFMY